MTDKEQRTKNRSYTTKGPGVMPHNRKTGRARLKPAQGISNWKGADVESYMYRDGKVRLDLEARRGS